MYQVLCLRNIRDEDAFMEILEIIELAISIVSIAVVVYGALCAVVSLFRTEFRRVRGTYNIQRVRVIRADFGTYLLLGLELLIAADILKTIFEPGLSELLVLGGIVLLRTILSFFLNREIKEIEKERQEHPEVFENI